MIGRSARRIRISAFDTWISLRMAKWRDSSVNYEVLLVLQPRGDWLAGLLEDMHARSLSADLNSYSFAEPGRIAKHRFASGPMAPEIIPRGQGLMVHCTDDLLLGVFLMHLDSIWFLLLHPHFHPTKKLGFPCYCQCFDNFLCIVTDHTCVDSTCINTENKYSFGSVILLDKDVYWLAKRKCPDRFIHMNSCAFDTTLLWKFIYVNGSRTSITEEAVYSSIFSMLCRSRFTVSWVTSGRA